MNSENLVKFSVKQFVAVFNQTLSLAYPKIAIVGEITDLKISHNKWLYFSLKEADSLVNVFGAVDQLQFPLEEGMMVELVCYPHLHDRYGFKLNLISLSLLGEGTIKKSLDLLKEKLTKEGIFDNQRKRSIVYPATKIGLIASIDSAAYSDFIKVISERFGGLEIFVKNVLVQGDQAITMIIKAINDLNVSYPDLDVIVITRGGGSMEDLQIFSSESLTRAVFSSRLPTLVAIGHERDISLSELAADLRASTPSNAAELLVPSKKDLIDDLKRLSIDLKKQIFNFYSQEEEKYKLLVESVKSKINQKLEIENQELGYYDNLIKSLNPKLPMSRGYALIKKNDQYITDFSQLHKNDTIEVESLEISIEAKINQVRKKHDSKKTSP